MSGLDGHVADDRGGGQPGHGQHGLSGVDAGCQCGPKVVLRVADFVRIADGDPRGRQVHADCWGVRPVVDRDVGAARFIGVGPNADDHPRRRGAVDVARIGRLRRSGHRPVESIAGGHSVGARVDIERRSAGQVVVLESAVVALRYLQESTGAARREVAEVPYDRRGLRHLATCKQDVGLRAARHREIAVIEDDVASHGQIVDAAVLRIRVNPKTEALEQDVVGHPLGAVHVLHVDGMPVPAVRRFPADVRNHRAIDLGVVRLTRRPEAHALPGVMDDEIDEAVVVTVGVDSPAAGRRSIWVGVRDLKAPEPGVAAIDDEHRQVRPQVAIERGAFAWILAHDDRRCRRPAQRADIEGRDPVVGRPRLPLVDPAPQPHRVARPHRALVGQRGVEVQRMGLAAVV